MGLSQLCRPDQGEFPTQRKSEFGQKMSPGRRFLDFGLDRSKTGGVAVWGRFVVNINQNWTLVGALERAWKEDSGYVLGLGVG